MQVFLVVIVMAGTAAIAGERDIPLGEQVAFGGAIVTTRGWMIPVHEFLWPLKDTYIQGEQDGRIRKFKASELREILFLEPGCPYGVYLHGVSRGCRLQITDLAGRLIRLINADFTSRNIEESGLAYQVLNRATGRIQTRSLRPADIAIIRIEIPVTTPAE